MLNEIRSLISLILLEDKYKEMTGKRYDDDIKKFSKFVSNTPKEAFENGYYVHFTDTPKIGLNPSSPYLKGYYFYPLTKTILREFIGNVSVGTRGQARGARYVYLVKISPDNILESDKIYDSILERLMILIDPIKENLLDTTTLSSRAGTAEIESKFNISLNDQAKKFILELKEATKRLEKEKSIENYEKEIERVIDENGASAISRSFFMSKKEEKSLIKVKNKIAKEIKTLEDKMYPLIEIMAEKYFATGRLIASARSLESLFSSKREYVLDLARAEIKKILQVFENASRMYISRDGSAISGREIGAEALKEFSSQTGIDSTSKVDSVGYFIRLAMGNEYDGVFDAGHAGGDDAGGDFVKMGLISNQEKTQLYLRPEARNRINVVSMIDRFEGEKEWNNQKKKEKEFGHHTPDVDITTDKPDSHPRVKALLPRLKTPTGEPRERYKSIATSGVKEEK